MGKATSSAIMVMEKVEVVHNSPDGRDAIEALNCDLAKKFRQNNVLITARLHKQFVHPGRARLQGGTVLNEWPARASRPASAAGASSARTSLRG